MGNIRCQLTALIFGGGQVLRHIVERFRQLSQLIAGFYFHARLQIALRDAFGGFLHRPQRRGDLVEEQESQQQGDGTCHQHGFDQGGIYGSEEFTRHQAADAFGYSQKRPHTRPIDLDRDTGVQFPAGKAAAQPLRV